MLIYNMQNCAQFYTIGHAFLGDLVLLLQESRVSKEIRWCFAKHLIYLCYIESVCLTNIDACLIPRLRTQFFVIVNVGTTSA